jgi:hypothetical protein
MTSLSRISLLLVRIEATDAPLQKRIRRMRADVMFEYAFNIRSNDDGPHCIAQQVAYHSHTTGMRDFHEHGEVRTVVPERRVGRMPDTLPTEDPAARFDLGPVWIEGMAAMAYPLGPKLPIATMGAALHQKPTPT